MAVINWGILGASKFAREHMGPALHAAAGGRLVALATRSPDRAAPFRDIAPDLRIHDSYDALLADPGIDAVYNPLPNSLHVEWTLKALAAGKHVLVEKPATLRAAEFDDLIAARDRSGRLAAEAYMIVFHPQWQRARQLVAEGAIGRLVHVEGVFSFDNRADVGNIRNQAEMGGGALRDIGVYVIGSTRFVTGAEPLAVQSSIRWESGFDAFTRIAAEFQGFTYNAVVSTRMAPAQEMMFYGEAGSIRLGAPFNAQHFGDVCVELRLPGGRTICERFNGARQYDLQVAAFNASASTGAAYPCPLEFSKGTQAMIDQVLADPVTLS